MLHEAGHALGIMGHSYNSDDIMYMSGDANDVYIAHRSDFQQFSARDINTIRLLYKLMPNISDTGMARGSIYAPVVLGDDDEITGRKIREAQHYIKEAPEMASGWTDLGTIYSQNKQYDKALEAFNYAYTLAANDSEKYVILYNTAITYLNKKDKPKALDYAQRARSLDDNENIRGLIKVLEK